MIDGTRFGRGRRTDAVPDMQVVPLEAVVSTPQERIYGAAAHMAPFLGGLIPVFGSFVATLLVWWWMRQSVFVARHARASINFQLSMLVYYGLALGYLYVFTAFGLMLLVSSAVFEMVSIVRAARRAKAGQDYQYRMCLEFLKHTERTRP